MISGFSYCNNIAFFISAPEVDQEVESKVKRFISTYLSNKVDEPLLTNVVNLVSNCLPSLNYQTFIRRKINRIVVNSEVLSCFHLRGLSWDSFLRVLPTVIKMNIYALVFSGSFFLEPISSIVGKTMAIVTFIIISTLSTFVFFASCYVVGKIGHTSVRFFCELINPPLLSPVGRVKQRLGWSGYSLEKIKKQASELTMDLLKTEENSILYKRTKKILMQEYKLDKDTFGEVRSFLRPSIGYSIPLYFYSNG